MTSADLERLYAERFVGFKRALATVAGDYDTAEEVLQEAFVRALRALPEFWGDAPLAAWVWQIAYRAALEQRRSKARRDALAAAENGSGLAAELVVSGHDPALVGALRALSPRRRLIVFLRYFADCSYAEIAAICEISEGTVAASLAQARTALAEALAIEPPAVSNTEEVVTG